MKRIACLLAAYCLIVASEAQTWQEWTQQKKTQIQYLVNQIAANKAYLDYLQKGYAIASEGLAAINSIKEGDFNLHRDFFASLKTVNPAISTYAKIANIIALQIKIVNESKQSLSTVRTVGQFTATELDHCSMAFDRLLEGCIQNIEELLMVITDEKLTMKHDERLKRIDKLYHDMQSKYVFCTSFGNQIRLLAVQRLSEQIEVYQSKIINRLK